DDVVWCGRQPVASTQNMPAAGAICTALRRRRPGLPTRLVGGHVAALPAQTLGEEHADFVCSGEGPYTILELLEILKAGEADYGKVRGLVYRDGDATMATPPAPLVMDLDHGMPGLAWDLLPLQKYRAHNRHCLRHTRR